MSVLVPGLRLMTEDDAYAVRALVLPSLSPADAIDSLPDTLIGSPSIGGRAEAIVMERLNVDLPFFLAGPPATLPAYYAQGDNVLAFQLMHDALIQFAAAQVIATGIAQQLVPSSVHIDGTVQLSYTLNWDGRRQELERQGYAALNLLRRPFPIPGRRFHSPAAGAHSQMRRTVRPSPGTHKPRMGRFYGGGRPVMWDPDDDDWNR